MNQEKPGSAVLALGGNTFFENMIEQLWLYAVPGVLAGDDVDIWAAVDADVDLARAFRCVNDIRTGGVIVA